jgi:alkylation response protein AidB-like acyl-CoA dehydrogenase
MSTTYPAPGSSNGSALVTEDMRALFKPVLESIAAGAVEREQDRRLPYEEVRELARVGFTRLTVPTEFGGYGRSLRELFSWLIQLAAADSNIPQLLRAHFATIEIYRVQPDSPLRTHVLTRAGAGEIFGNASHERAGADVGRLNTRLRREKGRWILNGTKYYSTGSLFADWVMIVAEDDEDQVRSAIISATAPGVELVDDWDGFGQRLTGSGTTVLTEVEVDDEFVTPARGAGGPIHLTAYVELVLLATMAGVSRAVARDAADFVRTRTRVYAHGLGLEARLDPLVQQVVGRVESAAFAAEAIVLHAVEDLQRASDGLVAGVENPDTVRAAELSAVRAQVALIPLVLTAAGELFEVGGASATSETRRLDRHWRNARTLASHNPAIYQARVIGDHVINGTELQYLWATGTGSAGAQAEQAA